MFDIRNYPDVIDAINNIINNKGIAEVKNEARRGDINPVVVEITRVVKTHRK